MSIMEAGLSSKRAPDPKSMGPLKAVADAGPMAVWVDDISIHTCLAGSECVFMVNSGSGMEVLLHDRPLLRFGRAEYDSVVPQAEPTVQSLMRMRDLHSDTRVRAAFIYAYLSRCIDLDEPLSVGRVLESGAGQSERLRDAGRIALLCAGRRRIRGGQMGARPS